MKNLFVLVLLAVFSATAVADPRAVVGVENDYIYRGASLNNGSVTLVGKFQTGDLFVDGLYLSADVAAWSLSNNMTTRTEAGIGYGSQIDMLNMNYALEVNHIMQSNARDFDYTEVTVMAGVDFSDYLTVFGSVAQIVGGSVPRNTYAEVGANITLFDRIWIRPVVAFGRNRLTGNTNTNHGEVSVGYSFENGFSLYGLQTIGNNGLDNHNMVGLSYSF